MEMIQEELYKLFKQINEWKEKSDYRDITNKMQRNNLVENLKEKFIELIEAENLNDEMEVICDISILCIGALVGNEFKISRKDNYNKSKSIFISYRMVRKKILNKNLFQLIFSCKKYIENLDFDYFKCIQERINKINSHTELYDDKAKNYKKRK